MFDDSLENISDVDLGNTFLCLTRWDIKEDGKEVFFNRSDSQDSWIFTSPISGQLAEDSDFFLGRMGCDNKIAYLAHKHGMKVTNPAHLIRTRHLHLVDHRTYFEHERVGGAHNDEFLKVHPTDDWELSRIGKVAEQYEEYK